MNEGNFVDVMMHIVNNVNVANAIACAGYFAIYNGDVAFRCHEVQGLE